MPAGEGPLMVSLSNQEQLRASAEWLRLGALGQNPR
jgi:hypothetical protein